MKIHETPLTRVSDVIANVRSHADLGFMNTTVYLWGTDLPRMTKSLKKKGYRVYSAEVLPATHGVAISPPLFQVDLEWH